MNLAVIGAGYVGLVTAAVFADFGHKVWVVDIDEEKISKLTLGEVPFFEPGLNDLVKRNIRAKRLYFTDIYQKAIPDSEIIFICVGTPNKNGKVNLDFVYQAAESIAKNLRNSSIIVVKSTVPPGINKKIEKFMRKFTKMNFDLASVPEFLREGRALEDTLHPYRVVIGTENKLVVDKLLKLHKKISGRRLICSSVSAQLIKYAANAFLPTKISYANSIAILCDKFGGDVNEVMRGMGMDKRIGSDFLKAGIGYGGSCFPKDIEALIWLSKKSGYNFEILKAVQKTNQRLINYFVDKVVKVCNGTLKDKKLAVFGLAFKPGTSDVRESRSLYLIKELQKSGAKIQATDPVAISEAKKLIGNIKYFSDPYEAIKGTDALILVTEWDEYKKLNLKKIKKLMKSPVIIDGRNFYPKRKLEKLGFIYECIGR